MIMTDLRCDDTEPHSFHAHEVEAETACTGQARCGAPAHDPHDFTETRRVWCPGICDCGMSRGVHGPGAHK